MFAIDFTLVAVLYAAVGVGIVAGVWFLCDRRDCLLFDATRRRTTFHCLKCDHLYSQPQAADLEPCPRCGHPNPRLRF